MEETKMCPYCGGEILSDAKKCKHCGKWLEKKCPSCGEWIKAEAKKCKHCGEWLPTEKESGVTQPPRPLNPIAGNKAQVEEVLPEVNSMATFISNRVFIVAFITILSEIVSCSHDFYNAYGFVPDSGFIAKILSFAHYIPRWIGDLLGLVGWNLFNAALMVGLKKYQSVKSLAKANFILGLILSPFAFLNEDSPLVIILMLPLLANAVITFLLGLRLRIKFSGEIKKMGEWMFVYIIVSVLYIIMSILENEILASCAMVLYIYTVIRYVGSIYSLMKL